MAHTTWQLVPDMVANIYTYTQYMYTDYTLILYASNSLRLRDCCNPNCSQLCGGTLQLYSEKLIQMPLLHINSCVIRCEHHHRWDKIWLC